MYVEHQYSLMFVWFFAVVYFRGWTFLSLGNLFLWVCICGNLGYWRSGFLGASWVWSSIGAGKYRPSWLAEDLVKRSEAPHRWRANLRLVKTAKCSRCDQKGSVWWVEYTRSYAWMGGGFNRYCIKMVQHSFYGRYQVFQRYVLITLRDSSLRCIIYMVRPLNGAQPSPKQSIRNWWLYRLAHGIIGSCYIWGCFNTPLEHTPKPLPTGYKGIPFIIGQGDCLGCALGVCCNFLGYIPSTYSQSADHHPNPSVKYGSWIVIFLYSFYSSYFQCLKIT